MERRAKLATFGAGIGVVLLVITWYAAFHVGFVERVDEKIFTGFGGLSYRPRVNSLANFIAHLCDPKPYLYFAALPVLLALARHRVRVAVTVSGILLGANLTTQLLKPMLAQSRAHSLLGTVVPPGAASWPSGHATAAMSLTLCLVLASPSRLRPAMATLGAVFSVAVSYSFLTLGWHYPSDVLGGFLVAMTWTLLGVAGLYLADARLRGTELLSGEPVPTSMALGPPALTLFGAVLVAAAVTIARPAAIVTYANAHETFVIGAVGIGVVALMIATGLMLALVRQAPR
jgi:membrane-associated phospholipid phosphatase